ncbi:MAG: TorF family putative porin [Rikenellaceae bacterium]
MKVRKFLLGLLASVCACSAVSAQVEVSGGVDFVSDYVWRGVEQGQGAALQPGMSVTAGNFTLGAWGSTGLGLSDAFNGKELDFTLGYEVGGFSISLTDYWWDGQGAAYFESTAHQLEASVGYSFGEAFPLGITWSTMVAGAYDEDNYSTYINFSYPFSVSAVDCEVNLGITPWAGAYADGFDICSVSARFSYNLVETDKFTLPIFVETIFAPAMDDAFIVAGLSFAM